jgi:hypothetical protein
MAFTCSGCDETWTALTAAHCGSCHRTFSGVGLFSLHRSAHGLRGHCLDPATVVHRETGEQLLVLRGGMYRGPAMSEEAKARFRKAAA